MSIVTIEYGLVYLPVQMENTLAMVADSMIVEIGGPLEHDHRGTRTDPCVSFSQCA